MTAPPDAAIQAGARVLACGEPVKAEHHWQALAVWRAMQAHIWRPIEDARGRGGPFIVPGGIAHFHNGRLHSLTGLETPGRLITWDCRVWQPFPPPPKPGDAP